MYEEAGATRERILIKLASTWEGIRAAELLEPTRHRTQEKLRRHKQNGRTRPTPEARSVSRHRRIDDWDIEIEFHKVRRS